MDLQKSAQLAAFIHDLTLPGRVSQNFQTHPEETRAGQKVWDIQQLDQAHRNGKCRQSCGGGMFLSLPLSHSVSLCPALTWSETRSLSGSACNNAPPPRVLACLQLLAGNYSAMQCLARFCLGLSNSVLVHYSITLFWPRMQEHFPTSQLRLPAAALLLFWSARFCFGMSGSLLV